MLVSLNAQFNHILSLICCTISGYSTHNEPLFKQSNMLKIADQLRLQELKLYFKYIHKNLPAYLLEWVLISNVNIHFHDTRTSSKIHTARTKHEFAKKNLKYNLPHIINDTPAIVVEKTHIQPTRFHNICKTIPHTQIYRYLCNTKLLFVQSISSLEMFI